MKIQFPASVLLRVLYFLCLVLLPLSLYSQETGSCAEKLKDAQLLFEKGQVAQVPAMIRPCLKSGFNREESLAAYKLLIQSCLFEEKFDQADSLMLAFLKKNPEYQVSPTDHSSFIHLFNNFRVKPVVQISFHIGTNLPFLTFIDPISTYGEPGKKVYSTDALNFFTSLEAKFRLNKKMDLNLEAGYSQLSFTNVEDFGVSQQINYTENQKRIEIPLGITYNILQFRKLTPYGRIGFGPAMTLSSSAKISVDPKDANNPIHHTGTDVNRAPSRIMMDLFAQVGFGVKYKTRGGFLFAEARSNFGLFNQTVDSESGTNDYNWFYYYTDDGFHINSSNFTLGYTQIFYKPSKRKQ